MNYGVKIRKFLDLFARQTGPQENTHCYVLGFISFLVRDRGLTLKSIELYNETLSSISASSELRLHAPRAGFFRTLFGMTEEW